MAREKISNIIRVDGSVERLPEEVDDMELEAVQKIVGGYVEHVGIVGIGAMWCNEDGLQLKLPFNLEASLITRLPVVGDVIIETFEEITNA